MTVRNDNALHEANSAERWDRLQELVTARFKQALLMDDTEELDQDVSYFDLGLTSLRLTEIKKDLEIALGLEIDATALFNQPTVGQLVDHLALSLPNRSCSID